ncbi:TPA: PTS sugar transporter subunit IIA [Escherichia coli]|nr:PTS sugar transporter subunit IIA [Escherichia coli]
MLTIQFLCPLPNGLHARPAWELKEQCSQWQSEITFINHRQNAKADAKSSLALIGTGTLFNDSCSLNISGSDEEQACRELARQACECRSAQEIEALLTAFAPEEDVRPLLALENIFVDQSFSNKEQAIQFLCGNLGVNGRTEHPFELEEDVWQREEIVTTGVGFGVAIPHTKSQWIRHSSISIARLVKPVDWQSEMGEVELVIMLTLGANEGMNHVKVFSQLARKLVNKNFRQSLFAAQDAQSILTLLETELTF